MPDKRHTPLVEHRGNCLSAAVHGLIGVSTKLAPDYEKISESSLAKFREQTDYEWRSVMAEVVTAYKSYRHGDDGCQRFKVGFLQFCKRLMAMNGWVLRGLGIDFEEMLKRYCGAFVDLPHSLLRKRESVSVLELLCVSLQLNMVYRSL